MLKLNTKRIYIIVGTGRVFFAYYNGFTVTDYKIVFLEVNDLKQRNTFTENLISFIQDRSSVFIEVIFDVDPQYFTSKILSKKLKGRPLTNILHEKLETDYPGNGIKMFKNIQTSETTGMVEYLLVSVPMNELSTFLFQAFSKLENKIIYYHSAPLQMTYLSNSKYLKNHSLVDDSNNQKKKLYQIIGNGQSSISLSIYFSKISGMKQVLSIDQKVLSMFTTPITNLKDEKQIETIVRNFKSTKDYMLQTFSMQTSLVRITVFFSKNLLNILSPHINDQTEELYFISPESFSSSVSRKGVIHPKMKSTALDLKDIDEEHLASIALVISCARTPFCKTENEVALREAVFTDVAQSVLLVCSAFALFLIITFQYFKSTTVPRAVETERSISNLRSSKHTLLKNFNQAEYYKNLTTISLHDKVKEGDQMHSLLNKIHKSLSESGSSVKIISAVLGNEPVKRKLKDSDKNNSSKDLLLSKAVPSAELTVVTTKKMVYHKFLSTLRIVLHNYYITDEEIVQAEKRRENFKKNQEGRAPDSYRYTVHINKIS